MNPTLIIVLSIFIIFFMTSLGSAMVFFFKKEIPSKINTIFLGFAGGVMIAASVWSLIIPSIEASNGSWIPAAIGFILGGIFLVVIDKIVPHIHKGTNEEEGPKTKLNKVNKLFLAVTIHNIPEGIAVGFALGLAHASGSDAAMLSALGVAIGMGLQNFPEGAALALPLKNETKSNKKAFLLGAASGAVEPIFAVLGFFLAAHLTVLQPWLLSFAAGAMIYVVIEDLIPDAQLSEHSHLGTWGAMIGFVVMMVLDIAL